MTTTEKQHRVGVLLQILGPDVCDKILASMPAESRKALSDQLDALDAKPPSEREVLDILSEFDRLLTFAAPQMAGQSIGAADQQEHAGPKLSSATVPLDLPDDPFEALIRISEPRLLAALRDEAPRTIALILSCLPEAKAASLLNQLSSEKRDGAVLQLKEKLTPPLELLTRLIQATVDKCASFVEQELAAEQTSADGRLAGLLRTMDPPRRAEVLQMLEDSDPDACDRIRSSLFGFADLLNVEQRSLQRILGEVDTRTLAVALKSADGAIQDRVLSNLSKRAREGLSEEISLLGNVQPPEIEEAQGAITKAMVELDRTGELVMETN